MYPGTGDIKITLTLQLPGTRTGADTRAMPADETTISQIQVLLFKPSGGPLVGSYPGTGITTDPGEPSKRNFSVDVIEGTFDLMVLANSKDIIDAANLAKDMSRQEAASRLQLSQSSKIAHNANTLIPFWGELNGAVITENATLDNISMLRALVKIDVLLNETAKDKFELQTVTLYHWQEKMALLPEHYDSADKKVTAPTNTGSGLIPVSTKATYTATDGEIINDTIRSKIYLNETPNPAEDDFPVMPCLVIGGQYNGETRYYRIDFFRLDENDQRTYHDLLRNYWYELTVTDILGNGYPNEEDAYEAKDDQIEASTNAMDDGDMSDIIVDGQYYLKVNKASFTLDREKRDEDSFGNDLTVETNHRNGWEITRVTDPDDNEAEIDMDNGWLRILPADRKGEGNPEETPSSKTIKLLLDENTGTEPRHAKIHLQVGRLLDFIVKVTQTTETVLELSVEYLDGNPVSELFFYEYDGWEDTHEPKEIRVRWSPYGTGYDCNVEVNMSGDELFAFGSATTPITPPGNLTDADGNHAYTIHPEPFKEDEVSQRLGNPFLHRGMRVTFRVTDKNNPQKSISKTIYLRHQHMAIISDNLRKAETQGQQGSFNIRSNTSWVIDEVVNEGILQNPPTKGTEGGNDIGNGNQLLYSTTSATTPGNMPAAGWAGRKTTLYLIDTQGRIPGRIPFTITGVHNDPNCYILNPAGSAAARTVDIPIRKLFWAWDIYAGQDLGNIAPTDLQAGTKWTAVYLNTDLNGPQQTYNIQTEIVHDNSNILEDVLRVTIPYNTTVSGNAVVGVTHQGKWLYTWHLWITGYNPDSNNPGDTQTTRDAQFMNRNLGALETKAEEWRASTHGMFYQWGRKDPLQVSTITTGSPEVNTANNLGNTLNNPDLFYRATSGYQDWFTNREHRSYQNDYLWNDDKNNKGIFDPCPEGWRVTGNKWGEPTNQWTNMATHFNSSEVRHSNGRIISREYYDNTIDDPAVYFYAGAVDAAGNWGRHTLSTGDQESNFLYNCTPPHDNPALGAGLSRPRNGVNTNNPFLRANAMPVRCTKEN